MCLFLFREPEMCGQCFNCNEIYYCELFGRSIFHGLGVHTCSDKCYTELKKQYPDEGYWILQPKFEEYQKEKERVQRVIANAHKGMHQITGKY